MQLPGAVLLAGLLGGMLVASVVQPSVADPEPGPSPRVDSVSARAVPGVVTEGERALLVGRVSPADGEVDLVVERRRAGESAWTTYAVTATDRRGAFDVALDTTAPTPGDTYRVSALGAPPARAGLTVTAHTACSPEHPSVDPDAAGEAVCLLQRLDRWRRLGLMGIGQQLNVSSAPQEAFAPVDELDDPVAVVGFDLEELARTAEYEYPFVDEQVDRLLALADAGAVLAASWHATNPFTGRVRLAQLLDETTPAGARFWADYDEKLELLRRFQHGDGGRHRWTAVLFRPFHEANGDWFWWGRPDPDVFEDLWEMMQDRAWAADVHHLVWAFSANRVTSAAVDPRPLVPRRVDLGGLDSYDPEQGRSNAADRLWLEGYDRVARPAPRMALTEVGPHGSRNGAWDPAVITRTVRREGLRPAYAMLWFDDGDGSDGITGVKQIGSLDGGRAWLRSCPNGLCSIR